jgi:hypothetical protein
MKKSILPSDYVLFQNFPNPFNPATTIMFAIPERSKVSISVYNTLGELINVLVQDELMDEGYHEIEFDGKSLASGIYLYRMRTDKYSVTKKMILIK